MVVFPAPARAIWRQLLAFFGYVAILLVAVAWSRGLFR